MSYLARYIDEIWFIRALKLLVYTLKPKSTMYTWLAYLKLRTVIFTNFTARMQKAKFFGHV